MEQDRAGQVDTDLKDRTGGLVVLGLVVVMLGILCALVVPLVLAAVFLGAVPAETGGERGTLVAGLSFYVVLAVGFIWLGVGSVRARRWACALLHVAAWLWLLTGLLAVPLAWLLLPGLLGEMAGAGGYSPSELLVPRLIVIAWMGALFVVLPGIMILFYRRVDVEATCRAKDPGPCWTDPCPPAVLSLVVLWALSAYLIALAPALGMRVPFFGRFLDGAAAVVCLVFAVAVCVYLTRGTALLDPRSWWLGLAAASVASLSATLTFLDQPVDDAWAAAGLGASSLDAVTRMGLGGRLVLVAGTVVTWVLLVALMIHVRAHFGGAGQRVAAAGRDST